MRGVGIKVAAGAAALALGGAVVLSAVRSRPPGTNVAGTTNGTRPRSLAVLPGAVPTPRTTVESPPSVPSRFADPMTAGAGSSSSRQPAARGLTAGSPRAADPVSSLAAGAPRVPVISQPLTANRNPGPFPPAAPVAAGPPAAVPTAAPLTAGSARPAGPALTAGSPADLGFTEEPGDGPNPVLTMLNGVEETVWLVLYAVPGGKQYRAEIPAQKTFQLEVAPGNYLARVWSASCPQTSGTAYFRADRHYTVRWVRMKRSEAEPMLLGDSVPPPAGKRASD